MVTLLAFLLINILFGFILCFYGRRIAKALVSIFIILTLGFYLYSKYGINPKSILYFLVFALIIALIFKFFVALGLFIIGSFIGAIFAIAMSAYLPEGFREYFGLIILLVALAFGLITALSQKKIIIFFTALGGANILSKSLVYLFLNMKNTSLLSQKISLSAFTKSFVSLGGEMEKEALILILVLTILGYLFQSRNKTKKK